MLKRHYLTIAFGLSLIFFIIGFSVYYVRLADVTNLIVVHFIARQGADVLGDKYDALGILTAGAIIALVNFFLAAVFYNRHRLAAYLIGIITIVVAFLTLLAIIAIVSVN